MAHFPTYYPAVGGANQSGNLRVAPSYQVSARALPGQMTVKVRQPGQGSAADVAVRDLKAELEAREREHFEKKRGDRVMDLVRAKELEEGELVEKPALPDVQKEEGESAGKNLNAEDADDADNPVSEADEEEESDEDDEDDEDDTDELMRELERIKRERAEEAARKAREQADEDAQRREEALLCGNPLLNLTGDTDFKVKRRWDDDVVFKNQTRDEPEVKKRFINDTIRSDFHRKFLNKYIQ